MPRQSWLTRTAWWVGARALAAAGPVQTRWCAGLPHALLGIVIAVRLPGAARHCRCLTTTKSRSSSRALSIPWPQFQAGLQHAEAMHAVQLHDSMPCVDCHPDSELRPCACTLTALLAAVFTNSSVEDICRAIDEEYQVAEARQSLSLAEQLEEAGVDPNDGFVLPWEDTNGFRRRLVADGSGNSQRQQRRQRLQGAPLAAGAGQRPLAAEQPAARAGVGPQQQGCQPRAPQHNNRRLLGGDMGDRVTDPLSVLAAARTDPNNPTAVRFAGSAVTAGRCLCCWWEAPWQLT